MPILTHKICYFWALITHLKRTPLKKRNQSSSSTSSHIQRTNCFSKDHSASTTTQPPVHRKNAKKTQNQTSSKELTPDLESKAIGPPDFRTNSEGYPLPPVHQGNTIANQTIMPLVTNSRSRSKRIQHAVSKTADMFCGGANIDQKREKTQLEGNTPSKHPKHLNNPKLKKKLTTSTDQNNRGDLQ